MLTIPLTMQNILTLLLIVVLTVIGTVYIWVLSTKKHCQCRLCRQEFLLEDCVAEGGFGAVYLIHRRNQPSQRYILKKLEMKDITELDKVQYEAKQLRMLQHRAIVSYEDEFLHINEGPFDNKYVYIIIMEYCANGDLTDKIREYWDEHGEAMPENKVMQYFLEVCEAVRYIHARDIIHRDIKSPNIFLTTQDHAKLGDFGLCIQGKAIPHKTKYSTVGTNCYYAPELHKGQLVQKGKPADIWALGCVLLELLTGHALWDLGEDFGIRAIEDPDFIGRWVDENVDGKYSTKVVGLVKRMMVAEPGRRVGIEELIKKEVVRQWAMKIRQAGEGSEKRRRSKTNLL